MTASLRVLLARKRNCMIEVASRTTAAKSTRTKRTHVPLLSLIKNSENLFISVVRFTHHNQ